jgi:formyltetrahydrofolate-dependent phosphoribosylglycinamide formyltransferase
MVLILQYALAVHRIGILIGPKGRGSNMLALATRIRLDDSMVVQKVVTPRSDAPGALAAMSEGLHVRTVPYAGETPYEERLAQELNDCDWVCLAGYMKLIPASVLTSHKGRILNIHPALLPKFGGKGMYGMHVHEAVIEAHETESGCTVHFVTEEYDEGEIILQASCQVNIDDSPEDLAARVLRLEHDTYYRALKKVVDGTRS